MQVIIKRSKNSMGRDQIYLNTKEKGYHYIFRCMECNTEYEIITNEGRYGNIGPFDCPNCKAKYHATIDDHQDPCLYIAKEGEQPASLLDDKGRTRSICIKNDGLEWH